MKKLIVLLALLSLGTAACAGQKSASKKEVADTKEPGNRPSSAIVDASAKPVDKATTEFQLEMDAVASESKRGGVDYADVASRMESLTKRYPTYGLAWFNLGVAYEQTGKLDEAARAYDRASKANPPVREARENLAAIAVKRGENAEAVSILRELVAQDPGASSARVAIAQQTLIKGDVKQAERLAKQALARDPRNLGAYCVLANAAVQRKDFRRARLVTVQGFKLDADAPCLHHALGLVALADSETALALVSFERAAAKDPRLLDARFRIAQISMGYKDFKKAIINYSAVTEVDPKSAAAFVNLGVALKGSGNFAEAEKAYLKAIEVAGTNGSGEAHFNLGVLYFKNLRRDEDAKTHFKRYLQLADAGSDDPAFAMLEEIDQRKAMEEESKRQEEEARKQEEIEAKIAAEQAKKDADAKIEAEAEKKRQEEIERKMKEAGEPVADPAAAKTDEGEPGDPEKEKEKPKVKKDPPKKKVEKQDPVPPPVKEKDFE
jgi:tetratricopeptide (TPR) repeat protein